jgi:hypothetical protein
MSSEETKPTPSFKEVMQKAGASAMRGGTAGAVAMGANVACLMVSINVGFGVSGDVCIPRYHDTMIP